MLLNSAQLLENYQAVLARIEQFSRECAAPQPQLLAVSKTKPAWMVETLYHAGQRDFGENYLQDALEKIHALQHLGELQWHFIGQIQSNKTATLAQHFAWVHSVDRLKIARRLSEQRGQSNPATALNLCLQINLDGEAQKGGVAPEDALALAQQIAPLDNIRLRGLMCIPKARASEAQQLAGFARLKALQTQLNQHGLALDTLSMGMSGDMRAAIAAGSTLVRIGSDLFGPRDTPTPDNEN